jgi:hypothetical protein
LNNNSNNFKVYSNLKMQSNFDDMPVGGGGAPADAPDLVSTNEIDEKPVGASSGQQIMEQQPVEVDHSGTHADR